MFSQLHGGARKSGNGTNDYGFLALPGGYGSDGGVGGVGKYGVWWSSTENDAGYAYHRTMSCYGADVSRSYGGGMSLYHSVRCLQD